MRPLICDEAAPNLRSTTLLSCDAACIHEFDVVSKAFIFYPCVHADMSYDVSSFVVLLQRKPQIQCREVKLSTLRSTVVNEIVETVLALPFPMTPIPFVP